MTLLELLRAQNGRLREDEDGNEDSLRLLPPLSPSEIAALETRLPCPLPAEMRELLAVTSGWDGGPLESVTFAQLDAFDLEGAFTNPLTLAHDGFGNFWIVDLLSTSTTWGPIYYACHDPPVVVYQCADLLTFTQSVLTMMDPPFKGPIDDVHEGLSDRIWSTNPGTITQADALTSTDPDIRAFAEVLPSTALIVDLRNPRIGDGFSWGRSGPQAQLFRHGEQALFAYDHPPKKSLWNRITGR